MKTIRNAENITQAIGYSTEISLTQSNKDTFTLQHISNKDHVNPIFHDIFHE